MVNVPYHAARVRGEWTRSLYKAALPQIVKWPISQTQQIPVSVYALSCERDLSEQVASIRSFLRYVGIPDRYVVMSDGSYTERSCQLLNQIHPCVQVIPIKQLIREDLPQAVYDYAEQHAMGKKLAALLSIPIDGTTIYADSDILFFPGATDLVGIILSDDSQSRYLPDCAVKFDERVIYNESEILNPINAGFIVFKQSPDWSFALKRLLKLDKLNNYFTEQTLVHLTLHYNRAVPLDPQLYILKIDDQFIYSESFVSQKTAIRHYVNNVRHKFWFNPEGTVL